ncbi:MAG: hypothetical protein ABI876_00380 [Bacteroidota bacterium]
MKIVVKQYDNNRKIIVSLRYETWQEFTRLEGLEAIQRIPQTNDEGEDNGQESDE